MPYANSVTIQSSDIVRFIFKDDRPAVGGEGEPVSVSTTEVILSFENARGLRDLLNQHIKDAQQ